MIFGEKNTIFYGEKHMRILNFGSCNIDTVYSVKHIVQAGETLGISSLNQFPGGKGLNQSIALARAGVKVYHAGCVGKEDMILIPLMQKAGIDVTHLKKVERQTGQAFIQLDENGQNAYQRCIGRWNCSSGRMWHRRVGICFKGIASKWLSRILKFGTTFGKF